MRYFFWSSALCRWLAVLTTRAVWLATTVLGSAAHIREGVVIRPRTERHDDRTGRVILKSVSGDYLTRKGDTTEFA